MVHWCEGWGSAVRIGGAVLVKKGFGVGIRVRIRRIGREVERKRKKGRKYNKKRKYFSFHLIQKLQQKKLTNTS